MTIDHRFIIRRLQAFPEIFAAVSTATKLPFVTCNEESFNDQIHLFATEDLLKEFIPSQKGYSLLGMKILNNQFLHFYGNLYHIGVNAILLHEQNGATAEIPLDQIVRRREDPKTLPDKKRPVSNPELMLTALYFIQEMRRQIPKEEKKGLAELDEELVANLVRARFLCGLEVDESKPAANGQNEVRVPYVTDSRGDMYQMIFSDINELAKFDRQKKLRPIVVPYDDLEKLLVENAKGYILNPQSIGLPLHREQLPVFKKRILG